MDTGFIRMAGVLGMMLLAAGAGAAQERGYAFGLNYTAEGQYDFCKKAGEETEKEKKIKYALWGSMERKIFGSGNKNAGILLQGSFAAAGRNDCKSYYGAWIVLNSVIPVRNENTLGIFSNRASFRKAVERTVEITWRCGVSDTFTLQPAFQYIRTGRAEKVASIHTPF